MSSVSGQHHNIWLVLCYIYVSIVCCGPYLAGVMLVLYVCELDRESVTADRSAEHLLSARKEPEVDLLGLAAIMVNFDLLKGHIWD